jgi:hypothetical protein
VKKIAQSVAQIIFVHKNNTLILPRKKVVKIWDSSVIFNKTAQYAGKKSTLQVTLPPLKLLRNPDACLALTYL